MEKSSTRVFKENFRCPFKLLESEEAYADGVVKTPQKAAYIFVPPSRLNIYKIKVRRERKNV